MNAHTAPRHTTHPDSAGADLVALGRPFLPGEP